MASSNVHHREEVEDEDRMNVLPDDILLSILWRVGNVAMVARTRVLSKRWKNLPWLLQEFNLNVEDFLPMEGEDNIDPDLSSTEIVNQAMASFDKAARSFLAAPHTCTITRLSLQIFLAAGRRCHIGPLLGDAIVSGTPVELDLAILDEKHSTEYADMLQQALLVGGFFSAYPGVLNCLTRLYLKNARFATERDINHLLFECCKQLEQLSLDCCDAGYRSVWRIDAPNSNLRVLNLYSSYLERLEVLCLPKLERLHVDSWLPYESPLRIGVVPSLRELSLTCAATLLHREFHLSKVLHGTTSIHTLTLGFPGEKIWMLPEGPRLRPAFNKLKKLSIDGIFVDFDMLWTIKLLEVAPSVEIFFVKIWEHRCQDDRLGRLALIYGRERRKSSWDYFYGFRSSEKWQLQELQFVGFRNLEQQTLFVRAIMERAPNLKTVLLMEDVERCQRCEDMYSVPPPPKGGMFPRDKDGQAIIVKKLTEGVNSLAQIVFSNNSVI